MAVTSTTLSASSAWAGGPRSDSRARLKRIRALWRAAEWHGWERGWWRTWHVGTGGFLAKFTPGAMVVGAELALWEFPIPQTPHAGLLSLPAWWVVWLIVIVVNTWLMVWLPVSEYSQPSARSRLARIGIISLGSIPLISFVCLPLARRLEGELGLNLSGSGAGAPLLQDARAGRESALAAVSSVGEPLRRHRGGRLFFCAVIWLVLPNMFLIVIGAIDLAQHGRALARPEVLLALAIGGHLAGAALGLLDRLEPASREGRRSRSSWRWLAWLLPLPLMAPVLLIGGYRRLSRDRGLVWRAWLSRGFLEASPRWSQLLGQLRRRQHHSGGVLLSPRAWRRPPEIDRTAQRWMALGQIRSSLLCTEGFAMGFLLGQALHASAENHGPIIRMFFRLIIGGGTALSVSAIVKLIARVRRSRGVLGPSLSAADMPVVRPLLLGCIALWVWIPVGAVVALGNAQVADRTASAGLSLAFSILGLMGILWAPGYATELSMRRYWWAFSLQTVILLATMKMHLIERSSAGEVLFWSMMLAALCSGLVFTLTAHRPLIHPFTIANLVRPGISRASRWKLIFVVATSVLPLGGLLAPLWPSLLQSSRGEGFRLRLRAKEGTS